MRRTPNSRPQWAVELVNGPETISIAQPDSFEAAFPVARNYERHRIDTTGLRLPTEATVDIAAYVEGEERARYRLRTGDDGLIGAMQLRCDL